MINAQDYIIANSIPEKTSNKKIVLDFGSGFGRQANIWNQLENENYVHISVDAIVKSYCLQWLYYSNFEREFHEYAIEKSAFILDEKSKGIYHLPTWRMDLIPSNYVDKITVVQVFQELNADLVKYIVKEFYRILKPNGSIYVRDHGNAWRPAHKLNMDKYLMNNGFTLEYKMHALDKIDIHGIPRIFRKTNNIAKNQEKVSMQQFIYEKKREFDSLTGGRLNKLIKKIKHK